MPVVTVNTAPAPETPAQIAARAAGEAARIANAERAAAKDALRPIIGDAPFTLNSFTNLGGGNCKIDYTLL